MKTRALCQINTKKYEDNIRAILMSLNKKTGIMCVVKANAYGHGVVPISRAALSAGARFLAVANLTEALEILTDIPDAPIFILSEAFELEEADIFHPSITYTVFSKEYARHLNRLCEVSNTTTKIHIKINTGMERLGLSPNKLVDYISYLHKHCPRLEIDGVMSHLSDAESPGSDHTTRQIKVFNSCLDTLKNIGLNPRNIHIANSEATRAISEAHYTLVRIGISAYDDVMTLKTIVMAKQDVNAGANVGYNCRYSPSKDTQIAVLPVGYADGYSTSFSNKGKVIINGTVYPIVGQVCMDAILVDIGKDSNVNINDEVVLLGRQNSAYISLKDLADISGLNIRETPCLVGKRFARKYVE